MDDGLVRQFVHFVNNVAPVLILIVVDDGLVLKVKSVAIFVNKS